MKGTLSIFVLTRSIIVMLIRVMLSLNQFDFWKKDFFSILDYTVFDADSTFMWILVLYISLLNFQQNIIVMCSCVKVDVPQDKFPGSFVSICYDRSSLQMSEGEINCLDQIQIPAATCVFELCQTCLTSTSWPLVHQSNRVGSFPKNTPQTYETRDNDI